MIRPLRRTSVRYFAFQLPGWVVAAWLLWLLVEHELVSRWVAASGFALYVLKDFALYPWLRDAYAVANPDASAALVGRIGEARDRLAPSGYVRIGSELWRAELAPGSAEVERGASVRVREVRGLTLVVEAC